MAETEFVFPSSASAWFARHERGEVPGGWPYGLDLLDGPAHPVTPVQLGPPGRPARLAWRARPRPARTRRTGLAWDEGTAHAMAVSRRYDRMHCGVIWATDRLDDLDGRSLAGIRRTLAAMRSVWVLSHGQLEAMDRLTARGTACQFVKFGVDTDFFSEADYPDEPLIFSAGGDRDRDHATLLEAFQRVVRARPHVRAVLQTKATTSAPGVTVIPHLSHVDLREMYRCASVVAIATKPNLHVSGMTVSLEAQATGRPAILTNTPGADDYVGDGRSGHLVAPADVAGLVDRLIDLVDDPGAAATMGRAARERVEADFTSQHLADRLAAALGPW